VDPEDDAQVIETPQKVAEEAIVKAGFVLALGRF